MKLFFGLNLSSDKKLCSYLLHVLTEMRFKCANEYSTYYGTFQAIFLRRIVFPLTKLDNSYVPLYHPPEYGSHHIVSWWWWCWWSIQEFWENHYGEVVWLASVTFKERLHYNCRVLQRIAFILISAWFSNFASFRPGNIWWRHHEVIHTLVLLMFWADFFHTRNWHW